MHEKYPGWSPYVYCADNPVKYIDPDGDNPVVLEASALAGLGVATILGTAYIVDPNFRDAVNTTIQLTLQYAANRHKINQDKSSTRPVKSSDPNNKPPKTPPTPFRPDPLITESAESNLVSQAADLLNYSVGTLCLMLYLKNKLKDNSSNNGKESNNSTLNDSSDSGQNIQQERKYNKTKSAEDKRKIDDFINKSFYLPNFD